MDKWAYLGGPSAFHIGGDPPPEPKLIEIGQTPAGYTIWKERVEAHGGWRYWSDSIGGGDMIWDTALASIEELEFCMAHESGSYAKAIQEENWDMACWGFDDEIYHHGIPNKSWLHRLIERFAWPKFDCRGCNGTDPMWSGCICHYYGAQAPGEGPSWLRTVARGLWTVIARRGGFYDPATERGI